jgi:hypothetical protein
LLFSDDFSLLFSDDFSLLLIDELASLLSDELAALLSDEFALLLSDVEQGEDHFLTRLNGHGGETKLKMLSDVFTYEF